MIIIKIRNKKPIKEELNNDREEYLYHCSHLEKVFDFDGDYEGGIWTHGLRPSYRSQFGGGYDSHSRGKLFLSEYDGVIFWFSKMEQIAHNSSDFNSEKDFGWIPVCLRVNKDYLDDLAIDELGTKDSGGVSSYSYSSIIEPEYLEIFNGKQWQSLESADGDNFINLIKKTSEFIADEEETEESENDYFEQEYEQNGYWEINMELFNPTEHS